MTIVFAPTVLAVVVLAGAALAQTSPGPTPGIGGGAGPSYGAPSSSTTPDDQQSTTTPGNPPPGDATLGQGSPPKPKGTPQPSGNALPSPQPRR